jgi:hypothetical protein
MLGATLLGALLLVLLGDQLWRTAALVLVALALGATVGLQLVRRLGRVTR